MYILKNKISILFSVFALVSIAITPAMARLTVSDVDGTVTATATTTKATKGVVQSKQIERIQSRSNQEIERRVQALTKLTERIGLMKRLSESQKNILVSELNSQKEALNSLQVKIAAETDIDALRADAQLIAKSYRIFALIIPQSHVMIAADRIVAVADSMNLVVEKLQKEKESSLISQSILDDMIAKITSAKTKAEEVQTTISSLVPDNNDQVVFKANKNALQSAHTKIRSAHADLVEARHDLREIMKAMHQENNEKKSATSTTEKTD